MNQLPPLDDIRVFVVAARLEGFSIAADHLAVSPAYVSKRIALLEKRLGVRLFLRSARHVRLTLEGAVALEWCEQLLDTAEQMYQALHHEQQVPRGKLRIVTSTGFGSHCVAPLISTLVASCPQLEVDLELLDRPVDLVSEGFDLEVRVGGALPSAMIARRLAQNRRVLCASPDYLDRHGVPDHPNALVRHRCIAIRERDQTFGLWRLTGPEGQLSVALSAALTTNNGAVAKHWCLQGQGIMLRSSWNIQHELNNGTLVPVLAGWHQPADIYVLYPSRLETSARLRTCVRWLERFLPAYIESRQGHNTDAI